MFQDSSLCAHGFAALLSDFDLNKIQCDGGTVFGMWADLTLAYTNSAWNQFAVHNDGGAAMPTGGILGRCVLAATAEPLRPFFAEGYRRCLRESRPWEHVYECSSADIYREFHMTTFPLGQAEGLLVVNSLRVESPHTRTSHAPRFELYRNADGAITQCCHCRRTQRATGNPSWDWVPTWITDQPHETSHGICPACAGFYYGQFRIDSADAPVPFSTIELTSQR